MRILLSFLCLFLYSSIHGQFARVEVNDGHIPWRSLTKAGGDNDFVTVIGGELYHITYAGNGDFDLSLDSEFDYRCQGPGYA